MFVRYLGRGTLRVRVSLFYSFLAFLLPLEEVWADTLDEALLSAYQNHPRLMAERASVRAVDESVPQALSPMRPRVSLNLDVGHSDQDRSVSGGLSSSSRLSPSGLSLTFAQTLFDSFQSYYRSQGAERNILAAREVLRSVEQDLLLETVTVYADVLRTRSALSLWKQDLKNLKERVASVRKHFSLGQASLTDVAQTESGEAMSFAQVLRIEAQVASAEAKYQELTGRVATSFFYPDLPLALLPATLDEALFRARENHPGILAARYLESAADSQMRARKGGFGPTLSLEASFSHRRDVTMPEDQVKNFQVVGRVAVPIYQSGLASSRVREAKELIGKYRFEVELIQRKVHTAVISAWNQYQASRERSKASLQQVQANRVALNGVRQEESEGLRTVLDVLNAQRALVDSEVQHVEARCDRMIAAYRLLASVGGLQVRFLGLDVELYDPDLHYREVRGGGFGLSTR